MKQRIIKFKAKRLDNGEWVEGDLYHNVDNFKCSIGLQGKEGIHVYPVKPYTICQFTGIYDRDNNAIFENDLIKDVDTKEVFELLWNPVFACYSLYDRKTGNCAAKNFADYQSKYSLIVGNKFDRKDGEK